MPELPSIAAVALAYLLGSIPWGLVLVRLFVGIDVRSVGSGNIGATNSARAGGKKLGLAVFVLDLAKGFAAVEWIARLGEPSAWLSVACAGAVVLGHCFPVWLRFKGGKGVASLCGATLALDPWLFLAGGATWLVVAAATRYVGLASLAMCVAFAVAAWLRTGERELAYGLSALALLIVTRHRSNMSRMLSGTEPKLFHKRASESASRG